MAVYSSWFVVMNHHTLGGLEHRNVLSHTLRPEARNQGVSRAGSSWGSTPLPAPPQGAQFPEGNTNPWATQGCGQPHECQVPSLQLSITLFIPSNSQLWSPRLAPLSRWNKEEIRISRQLTRCGHSMVESVSGAVFSVRPLGRSLQVSFVLFK